MRTLLLIGTALLLSACAGGNCFNHLAVGETMVSSSLDRIDELYDAEIINSSSALTALDTVEKADGYLGTAYELCELEDESYYEQFTTGTKILLDLGVNLDILEE